MSETIKKVQQNSTALYENSGDSFSDRVQNLANFIKDLDDKELNDALNMVIGVVPESRKRDLNIEAVKAEIVELKKQRDDYKERAYKMADQRPLLHDLSNFGHINPDKTDYMDEQREQEAEEQRKAAVNEFLGGL